MIAYAEDVLGIRLDRWQRRAINRALARWPDGRLVHRQYLLGVGRQNGKTVVVRAIIGWALWALRTPEWRMILGLAHDRRQAAIPYRAVMADLRLEARRLGPATRGGITLTRYLGIRSGRGGHLREYHTFSREARDAIRGESGDLVPFDEVRTQRDFDTWAAVEPTTRARPDALILLTSTAGNDRSVLLRELFDRGLRIIDGAEPASGFGMTWYAASEQLAPDDPREVLAANPAVAEGRVRLEPVLASYRSLTLPAYRSETLNLWTEGTEDPWLPPGVWLRQVGAQPAAAERIVLAVEAVPSWMHATVAVGLVTDDRAWCGVAGELEAAAGGTVDPNELAELLRRLVAEWRPTMLVYSAAAAAAPYAAAVAAAVQLPVVPMTPRQLRQASELFRGELVGARLEHGPDELLALQARHARPSSPIEGGDWYLSIRQSLGNVDALRACAWSSWAAIAPPEVELPPQVFV